MSDEKHAEQEKPMKTRAYRLSQEDINNLAGVPYDAEVIESFFEDGDYVVVVRDD